MKIFILLSLLAVTQIVNSAPTWHTANIKQVYPLANGDIVLMFDADHPECQNNGNPKYYYLIVGENELTTEGQKNLYSAALTAAATGNAVTINFESTSPSCAINRLSVNF